MLATALVARIAERAPNVSGRGLFDWHTQRRLCSLDQSDEDITPKLRLNAKQVLAVGADLVREE
jgi:hypothetical protein